MNVIVCNNAEAVADKAYEIVADIITAKPDAVLGLATGSTPVGLYRRLIEGYRQGKLSFRKIRTLNLDEYVGLPETHDQSYRYFMNDNLFDHIDIDKKTYNEIIKQLNKDFEKNILKRLYKSIKKDDKCKKYEEWEKNAKEGWGDWREIYPQGYTSEQLIREYCALNKKLIRYDAKLIDFRKNNNTNKADMHQ